jgi:ammonia channel protein AmtB
MNAGDTAWVLVSAGLVMVMVPGLALFYGGQNLRSGEQAGRTEPC